MPTIHFLGQVFPRRGLGFSDSPTLTLNYDNLSVNLTIHVHNSDIDVECEMDNYDRSFVDRLHLHVLQLTRSCIDTCAFTSGTGLTTVLEYVIEPDGIKNLLVSYDAALDGLCMIPLTTWGQLVGFETASILNMLTSTLEQPPIAIPINCERAVEAIGRLVSPYEPDRKKRWIALRENLHATQDYLHMISDASKGPRHGELKTTSDLVEIRERAWTVMARFLEFRYRNAGPLPIYFRLSNALTGSSEPSITHLHTPTESSPKASTHALSIVNWLASLGKHTNPLWDT
jgi:hypothetical protein